MKWSSICTAVGQLPAGHLLNDLDLQVLDAASNVTELLAGHELRLTVTPGGFGASTSLVTLGRDDYQDGEDGKHFVFPSSTVLRAVDIHHGDGPGLLLNVAGSFVSNESGKDVPIDLTPCSLRGDVAPIISVTDLMVSFDPPLAMNAEASGKRKRDSSSSSNGGQSRNTDLVATALSNAGAADAPVGGPGVAVVVGADHSGGFPNIVVTLRNSDGSLHVPLAETIEQGLALKLAVKFAVPTGKKNNTVSGTHSFAELSSDGSTIVFPALGNGSATGADASAPALKVGDYKFTVTFTETREAVLKASFSSLPPSQALVFGDNSSQLEEAEVALKGEFCVRVLPGAPARLAPKRKGMLSMLAASDRVNDDSGRTLVSSGVLALHMVDNGGAMVSAKSLSLLTCWTSESKDALAVRCRIARFADGNDEDDDGDEDLGNAKNSDDANGLEGNADGTLPQLEGCDADGWVLYDGAVWSDDGHEFTFRAPLMVAAGTGAREGRYSLVFEVTGLPDSARVEPLSAPFTFSTDAARAEAERAKLREQQDIETKLEPLRAQWQEQQQRIHEVIILLLIRMASDPQLIRSSSSCMCIILPHHIPCRSRLKCSAVSATRVRLLRTSRSITAPSCCLMLKTLQPVEVRLAMPFIP